MMFKINPAERRLGIFYSKKDTEKRICIYLLPGDSV